jgi:hypothetical protein
VLLASKELFVVCRENFAKFLWPHAFAAARALGPVPPLLLAGRVSFQLAAYCYQTLSLREIEDFLDD